MLTIAPFDPKYLPDFVRLNREWIEKHFRLEPMDLHQLEHPQEAILDPGGEILFLLENGAVVGTIALVPHGPGCYEIAKMAVDPAMRGRGLGDRLIEGAEAKAREMGAKRLILLSNTVLTPAISLYQKHGYRTVHLGSHPDYARSNIEMEKSLDLT